MKKLVRGWSLAVVLAGVSAAPALAQEGIVSGTRGYMSLFGGTVWAGDSTANLIFEGGGRVAQHLLAFGTLGRFGDLQTDLTPSLNAETAALAGLRAELPVKGARCRT